MEYKKMDLCRPCTIAIESEGKKLCLPVKHGINNKVTCGRCQRRRYGMTYELVDTKSKAQA
nr:hypothetical protein [uncultured Oscillibacter sp.]